MMLKYPPVLQVFVSGLVAWGAARLLPALDIAIPLSREISVTLYIAGCAILAMSVGLFALAKTTVNPVEPNKATTLVTTGLYRVSRNPMYLAMLLIVTGWSIMQNNLAAFFSVVLFITTMTFFQIRPEEKAMQDLFGEDYKSYRQRVRRWL
ncbi:isoprenylcysteine carboxylmethyltransferase family protein [Parvularcula sp. IMCC14364]|uniref:methyltransferase family protein n=1 Tax=Parvularcula sp. IMCC14364 TaxID=3067902 RepID=UPI002741D2DB|nr:isoprenylcysteine carboxylmethyltransferase family protein [Parvularcula sp. IMCC14364]